MSGKLPHLHQSEVSYARPLHLFISYHADDWALCKLFWDHIAILERQGLVKPWSEDHADLGDERTRTVNRHLARADIVLLMISASYVARRWSEMERVMQRHHAGSCKVIPILLRDVVTEAAPFAGLTFLPRDRVAIARQCDSDSAWTSIITELRGLAGTYRQPATLLPATVVIRTDGEPCEIRCVFHDQATLGRHPACEFLCLEQLDRVSRRHARLYHDWGTGGCFLEDLKSSHGTTVDGRVTSAPARLKSGSVVTLGRQLSLVFESCASVGQLADALVYQGGGASGRYLLVHGDEVSLGSSTACAARLPAGYAPHLGLLRRRDRGIYLQTASSADTSGLLIRSGEELRFGALTMSLRP